MEPPSGEGLGAGGRHPAKTKSPVGGLFHPASNIQDEPSPDPNEPATRAENTGGSDKVAKERDSQDAR